MIAAEYTVVKHVRQYRVSLDIPVLPWLGRVIFVLSINPRFRTEPDVVYSADLISVGIGIWLESGKGGLVAIPCRPNDGVMGIHHFVAR